MMGGRSSYGGSGSGGFGGYDSGDTFGGFGFRPFTTVTTLAALHYRLPQDITVTARAGTTVEMACL